jgi:hypothetical protein
LLDSVLVAAVTIELHRHENPAGAHEVTARYATLTSQLQLRISHLDLKLERKGYCK